MVSGVCRTSPVKTTVRIHDDLIRLKSASDRHLRTAIGSGFHPFGLFASLMGVPLPSIGVGQGIGWPTPRRKRTHRVLGKTAVAHFAKALQPLYHAEPVPHPRADARLVAVLCPHRFINDAASPGTLIREVPCLGRLALV